MDIESDRISCIAYKYAVDDSSADQYPNSYSTSANRNATGDFYIRGNKHAVALLYAVANNFRSLRALSIQHDDHRYHMGASFKHHPTGDRK